MASPPAYYKRPWLATMAPRPKAGCNFAPGAYTLRHFGRVTVYSGGKWPRCRRRRMTEQGMRRRRPSGGTSMGVMDLFDLSGRVVLVTGAGSGLGQGFAQAVGEAGAAVACADVNDVTAKQTAEKVRALGRNAI